MLPPPSLTAPLVPGLAPASPVPASTRATVPCHPRRSPQFHPETTVTRLSPGQQTSQPNIAGVHPCLLGSHNFAARRAPAGEFPARWPDARQTVTGNRACLGRAVRCLAVQAAIRQFPHADSGGPAVGGVHAIAHQAVSRDHATRAPWLCARDGVICPWLCRAGSPRSLRAARRRLSAGDRSR
jgi:hypothetical protein